MSACDAVQIASTGTLDEGLWRQFTLADGLPDLKVESLCVTRQGLLWVGTHDRGAACYDGHGFTVYDRSRGMPGSSVFCILEDDDGTLYFGTENGLAWLHSGRLEPVAGAPRVWLLWGACRDSDGVLWFGLNRRPGEPAALLRRAGSRVEIVPVSREASASGESVHRIVCDHRGTLWIGGDRLYRRPRAGAFELVERPGAKDDTIRDVIAAERAELWLACRRGLFLLGTRTAVIGSSVLGSPVVGLKQQDTRLYLLTYGGRLMSYQAGRLELLRDFGLLASGALVADRDRRMWIGVHGGLFCHDASHARIMKANAENQPHVTCILDRGTALYVGAREGLYQASGGRLHRMDLGPEIAGAAVTAGCRDISGAVWLGFWNGAVICLDGSEQRFLELREPIPGAGRISDLVVDAAGHVWLASASAGIVARCRKQEDLLAIDSHAVLTQTWVGAMVRAPDGTLWLGAGRGAHWRGVACLDGCRVVPHLGLPEGVVVRSLVPLASGEFWVGTQDGLFLLSPGRAVRYGGEHGLPCTIITALLLDRDGTLWIGTEGGGVCRHDGSVFQTIGLPPGSAFAVIRCLHEDASGGRVWLGTDGGLIEYTRRTQQPSVAVEPLAGEGVGTDGEVARVSSSVGRVVFRLRGAGSGLLDRLVYRYRLFGHDREWQQTRDTCVEYADLQPGSYEFAVQAVDSDLNYSRMAGVKLAVSDDAWHALLVTAQVQRLRELPERRGRIVLVDEDRAYGVALRRLLARIGHELEVLPSVDAAREHLRHGSCDLVLLRAACQAPRLVQDIWALRGHGADCDVVVLGAHDSIGAAQQCARLGPAAVLPRTAAPQELVRAVERVLLVRWDPVATYLRRHLDTVGGRADLARRCHVSPGTILNHFTRCAGVSYSQFEQRVRMERAMGLLVHSHLDIKQVASRVGMSPAAFARAFRRVAGCTPLHFRRMARIPLSQ